MYVYKLNEDIILYKHSSENNQSSSHIVLAHLQHKLVILMTVHKEDLKNHVDSYYHPSHFIESSDQKSSYRIISFLFSRNWVVVLEWNFASCIAYASDYYNLT